MSSTWWLIPLSKWVITPIISGLTLLFPFITGVITHLLSGMSHQVWSSMQSGLKQMYHNWIQWIQWWCMSLCTKLYLFWTLYKHINYRCRCGFSLNPMFCCHFPAWRLQSTVGRVFKMLNSSSARPKKSGITPTISHLWPIRANGTAPIWTPANSWYSSMGGFKPWVIKCPHWTSPNH